MQFFKLATAVVALAVGATGSFARFTGAGNYTIITANSPSSLLLSSGFEAEFGPHTSMEPLIKKTLSQWSIAPSGTTSYYKLYNVGALKYASVPNEENAHVTADSVGTSVSIDASGTTGLYTIKVAGGDLLWTAVSSWGPIGSSVYLRYPDGLKDQLFNLTTYTA